MKYKILNFDTLSSTNLYLKNNYQTLDNYTVVNTEIQTNGRGRENRIWNSLPNDDLTFSILLKPNIDSNKISLIPLVMGASLCITLRKYINCQIKWPNDILINGKKIAGILVEAVSSNKIDAVIVGVGININSLQFPSDLIMKATSLKLELNKEINKEEILSECLKNFDMLYTQFINNNNSFLDIVKKYNYLKNKDIYINNKKVKALDIAQSGNLIILDNEQIKEIYYGEVTLNQIYNNGE